MHLNLFPEDDENNLMNFFKQFILQANNAIFIVIDTIKNLTPGDLETMRA